MRVHELAEELGMTSEDLLAELRAATPTSADSEVTPALAQLARDRAEQRRVARAKAWLPAPVRHLLPSRPLVKRFGTELAAVYIFLCLLAGMSGTTLVLKLVDFGPLTPADGLALGQIVLGIFPLSLAVAVTGVLLTHMERDAWHPYLVLALVVIVMTVALAVAVAVGHVDNIELSVGSELQDALERLAAHPTMLLPLLYILGLVVLFFLAYGVLTAIGAVVLGIWGTTAWFRYLDDIRRRP
jgi:Translation initiation factor IF-2, N-terminal region